MEVEKKRSKGGFLNLFDWNGKSRKKLFANNLELDEESKKGKENVGKLAKSLLHVIEVDESRGSLSNKGSSEFNCSSSVTSDDGCGARAPGVVARLMGLDSLPTSNVSEACSDPYRDLPSFRASHYDRSDPHLWSEDHPVDYLNVPNRGWLSYNHAVESRVRKVQNRPIERFQTEILPPKSAKSVPITHHKLFSPIKSPGFVLTKNTHYIMEAAAKIEASPQSTAKSRRPSVVSSVPLRIWDLKDKMEAAHLASRPQKSNDPVVVSYTKGQNSDRRNSEPKSGPVVKASMNLDKRSSDNTRKKGKSVSLGEQSKVNVQRREGSTSTTTSSSRSSMQKKEKCDVKANQFSKGQPDTQKPPQKGTFATRTNTGTYANRTNNALRQNNQKQNYMPNKDSATLKTAVYNQQNKKTKSIGGSNGTNGALNKVITKSETVSRKTASTKNDVGKEDSTSRAKSLTQKKQSLNGDSQSEESNVNNILNKKDARSIKCNVAVEGCVNWSADSRKKGMDIVSFTFSSPIRSVPDPQSSGQVMEKTNSFNIDSFGDNNQRRYLKNLAFSSPGCNLIDNGALTVILEQKLKELTCKVESSNCNVIRERSTNCSASSLQDSVSKFDVLGMNSVEHGQRSEIRQDKDISDSLDNSCCTSTDSLELKIKQKWQFRQSEEMENYSCGSNRNEPGRELDCRHSSPVSSLEPSSITSVCCSDNENSTADSKQSALAQDHVEISSSPTNVCQPGEGETRLSDLAPSIVAEDKGERDTIRTVSFVGVKESCNWELTYVREVLSCAELMVHEFALGQIDQVITPNLFNCLESQESETGRNGQEESKVGRKALFDSICECLNVRCQQLSIGSCKVSAKSSTLFRRKSLLAEELYKEIVSWKSMGDLMVDELVDKDMSSHYGKWVDFDMEAFEEGVEIENGILTSLVDELLSDFLIF